MFKIKSLVSIFIIIFSINNVVAQFGQQGSGFGQNGVNRGSQGGFDNIGQPSTPDKPSEMTEKEKKQAVDKILVNLKKELTLDELQVIGVQNVLYVNVTKQDKLFKKEISQEEKIIEMQGISDNTDRKIIEFLNKTQKVKYLELSADRKAKLQEMVDKINR